FVPSVSGYMYAANDDNLYVNLYASNEADIAFKENQFKIVQTTNYPWSGDVVLNIENDHPINANLMLRIPGWAMDAPVPSDLYAYKEKASQQTVIKVNGKPVPMNLQKGYAVVPGTWKKG